MRDLRALAVAFVLVGGVGSARVAFAQDADIAQARALGQQAQAAYDAVNYPESERLWAAAAKLYPAAPTLTLGLARAQNKNGKLVAAQESYNRIIREWSPQPSPPPAFKDALEAARAEMPLVAARVASVIITVDGPTTPIVSIDGAPVSSAALGSKRPVDPGAHVVKASADGFKAVEQSFQVAEGGSAELKLKLEAATPAVVPVALPPPQTTAPIASAPPPAASPSDGRKTAAIVAFGVGGAGLVLGAVTGVLAIGKHSDIKSACGGSTCPSSEASDISSYKTMGTLSTVGFVVAGAGAAAGVVLVLTAPKDSTSAWIGPYIGGSEAGVIGRF